MSEATAMSWLATILRVLLYGMLMCHQGTSAATEEDHGDTIPVTIRPILAPGVRPIFVRRSFEPASDLMFCSVYSLKDPNQLDCTTVSHGSSMYVDLEQIEPLLVDQRVLCDERAVGRRDTEVVLPFISLDGLKLAQSVWGSGENLIFMAEDDHCFQEPGDRSFYRSKSIRWDHESYKAIILATPLMANIQAKSGWAHNVTRGVTSLPDGFFPHPRRTSGYTAYVDPALFKRGTPAEDSGTATAWCILEGAKFGPLGCILGVPYHSLIDSVSDADDASLHIKVGADMSHYSPVLGGAVAAIGAILAPSHITWSRDWDFQILKEPIMAPWLIPKMFHSPDSTSLAYMLTCGSGQVVSDHIKLPHVTFACANCHMKGKFNVTLKLSFDLLGNDHKGPDYCYNSAEEYHDRNGKRGMSSDPKIGHEMWLELLRIRSHVYRKRDERLSKRETRTRHHDAHFKRGDCDPSDFTWPVCNLEEILNYHAECDPYLDNTLLHPTKVIGKSIVCLFKTFIGHARCWREFHEAADHFVDFKDYGLKVVQRHLHEAKFSMNVEEDVDMFVHPKVSGDFTGGMWFDLDFGIQYIATGGVNPVPSWGFLLAAGGSTASVLNGGPGAKKANTEAMKLPDGSGNQKGWGGATIPKPKPSAANGAQGTHQGLGRMTWGLPVFRIEFVLSLTAQVNITFPGFEVHIGKGTLEIDLLKPKGRLVQSTMPIKLKYLKARVDVSDDMILAGSVSFGPAFDFTLTPTTGVLAVEGGDYMMSPFAFGGHLELLKIELQGGAASADHTECKNHWESKGMIWDKDGYFVGIYLRHGVRFYGSFFGFRISTDWIGKLQRTEYAVNGLYYSQRLALHCGEFPSGFEGLGSYLSEAINGALDVIQTPIEKAVDKIAAELNGAAREFALTHGKDIDTLPDINGTALSYESFILQHGLEPPPAMPNFAPDALPEYLGQCLAKAAWKEKTVGIKDPCSHLGHDVKFDWDAINEAVDGAQTKALRVYLEKQNLKPEIVSAATVDPGTSTGFSKQLLNGGSIPLHTPDAIQAAENAWTCRLEGDCP